MSKRLVILGGGESGVGAALLAQKQGYAVFVSDKGEIKKKYKDVLSNHGIEWEELKHTPELILTADEVIKSPGIPQHVEIIKAIRAKGISVISEIEFAARFTNAKMICVTGSNGKTTTASLIYHVLQKAGLNVALGGNVGKSFAALVAEGSYDYFVLELSSFQLEDMYEFKAHIAIITNITPDHLDRYEYDVTKYAAAKFRITQNQTTEDTLIWCLDDEITNQLLSKVSGNARRFPFSIQQHVEEGAFVENNQINITVNNTNLSMTIEELALQGKHNLYNSMAAGIAGRLLDVRKETIRESLSDFQSVEHRLEFVARINNIDFINDSKATNVNSTWYALESMSTPVVWIVGGVDKGNDYTSLFELVKEKVRAIICLGTDNSKIISAFGDKVDMIVEAGSAQEAVALSYRLAKKGDSVLLSPACASFDMFENYEDRGRQFKSAVKGL
ncbi:MAG: UDP-N-acetylmuramoyl-L-alanine--D-glutamate ligase [Bacteroidetes bacterium]|jgi:UDP-N-acetylmuramoylalanine--D-glutamate ligase|nr:UDP-N-acetylmuramoyl-L-alanine--D-glutamate ligase [Bacteroidota bacterium]